MALNHSLQPMRDYQLAKKYVWNPQEIDLTKDTADWQKLSEREQRFMQHLCTMFTAGEEAVATDLAPLLYALGKIGNLREEEMFVTTQIFDESLHVEFFHRWFDEVVSHRLDVEQFYGEAYRAIFFKALPQNLEALLHDYSPQTMTRALLTYHITVEGMLAETGYHAIFQACERRGVLPGLAQGVSNIKRDESRHIAYGIYALQRMLTSDPALIDFVRAECDELINTALGIIPEALAPYGDDIPFGVTLEEMITYAGDQFDKRMKALERVVL